MLVDGMALDKVARRRGAALGTVRGQLKMLFHKTEVQRQAELVLKLARYLEALRNRCGAGSAR